MMLSIKFLKKVCSFVDLPYSFPRNLFQVDEVRLHYDVK